MTPETFIEHFETLAEAPNGIEKLRELILQLAVQGKLVPQDPNDEPTETLGNVENERTDEPLFEVPAKWVWARLSNLAEINGGFAFKSTDYTEEGMRVVRISDFDELGFKDHKVVRHPFTPELARFSLSQSNILMAMTGGTVGKSYLVRSLPEPMIVNQRVATIKVFDRVDPCYIDIVIRSEMTQEVIRNAKNSTNDNISMGDIKGFAIPLPPLAEQRRIVAKVDQLLGLCDELAARQAARREARSALVGATLDRLVSARSSAEFPTHAHRLRDHFDRLFDTPTTIPQLRQAILQLAVQGQLVPQDPNDEPTVELPMEQLVGRENMKNGLSLTQTTSPSQFGCVPISSMRDGVVDCSFTKPVSISEAEARQFLIRRGDVFLMRGNGSKDRVGRAGLVVDEPRNAIFPDLFIRLILDQSRLLPAYFLVAWNSPALRTRIEAIAKTTSGIWKINQGHVASLSIPVPPLAEQKRIVSMVTELLSLCDAFEAKLTQAESASTQLLSAAVGDLLKQDSREGAKTRREDL